MPVADNYKRCTFALPNKTKMINKSEIIKRIEAITKHTVSSSIILKPNGKNFTCEYYDCTTDKNMKCTIKYGFLPSNIREAK